MAVSRDVQGKLSDDSVRSVKRERSRTQLLRRQNRLQRTTHDVGRTKDIPAAASCVRFTSFLVADILGIASCSPPTPDHVTSSEQQPQKSDDFRVERLIHNSSDENNTTTSTLYPSLRSSTCLFIDSLTDLICTYYINIHNVL